MTIHLGVDAGNSKTVALACLPSGKVAGAARAGCGDIYGAPGEAAAVAEVLDAVDAALAEAGATRADVACAAFRLAGVDWPEDWEFWDAVLRGQWPGLRRSILNDGYAAIRCGEPSGVGVAVNAGTAAAVAARGPDGATWQMGWWGQHAMGGIGLVSEAMRAAFLAELDAAPATSLGPALVEFYGLPDLTELNRWYTRRQNAADPAQRPRAARVVMEAARRGDSVATQIVREQGRRLAFYAQIAARKVGLTAAGEAPVPVVMSGSILMDPDSPVAAALRDQLPQLLPGADPRHATLPPVAGAALDALAEGGVTITPAVVSSLEGTIPRASFFRT
jgi:N-acetylglucosamine kinase-like BadF-type ATPase